MTSEDLVRIVRVKVAKIEHLAAFQAPVVIIAVRLPAALVPNVAADHIQARVVGRVEVALVGRIAVALVGRIAVGLVGRIAVALVVGARVAVVQVAVVQVAVVQVAVARVALSHLVAMVRLARVVVA